MDFLNFILNNGYSINGRGGLGYRPPIIGGAFELVKFDPETNTNNVIVPYKDQEPAQYELEPSQPIHFLWDLYLNPKASTDDKMVILKTIKQREGEDENYDDKFKKYLTRYNNDQETKKLLIDANENKYSRNDIQAVLARHKNALTPKTTATKAEKPIVLNKNRKVADKNHLLNIYNDSLDKSKVIEYEDKYVNNPSPTIKGTYKKRMLDVINYGLDLIKKNPTINTDTIKNSNNNLLVKVNNLISRGNKLKIENNELVEIEKENEKDPWKQEKELMLKEAKAIIDKFTQENQLTILTKNEDNGKEINKIIDEINTAETKSIFDLELKDKEVDKSEVLSNKCINKKLGDAYLSTVEIDGDKFTKAEMKSLYGSGKALEFGVCGLNNSNAMVLFGVQQPKMEVTDFIVEDIYLSKVKPQLEALRARQIQEGYKKKDLIEVPNTSLGAQFCQDNVDRINKIINEMKDYNNVNYQKMYNYNIKLKKIYFNYLKTQVEELIEEYTTITSEKKKEKKLKEINEYKSLMTNKENFDKAFYKNRKYLGIPITINKWNPVEIPEDHDDDDAVNTEEQLKIVQSLQGQKFIPHMKNKYINKYEQVGGSSDIYNKLMTKYLNEDILKGNKFEFMVTVRFSHAIGVYNYTKDPLVTDDNILGTYKASYSHDKRILKYNSVLIPIEKYVMKK
jgi:hypothetical protein